MGGKAKVDRARLEHARDMAMVHALFFWQLSDRAVNVRARAFWEERGRLASGHAIRLDQEVLGYALPWEERGRRRHAR